MKKLKENKAITLIALVITIVVLVILASVAITLSLGNNGIFNKAKYAKQEYLNGIDYEETELSKLTNSINEDSIIIDSTRDTVTISQEEYNRLKNANEYSTDEIEIGHWINGKPLYRKVVQLCSGNLTASTSYPYNIPNLEYTESVKIFYTRTHNGDIQ